MNKLSEQKFKNYPKISTAWTWLDWKRDLKCQFSTAKMILEPNKNF